MLSLILALAPLAAVSAPQEPEPEPTARPIAPAQQGYGGMVGSFDPRFQARTEMKKTLFETGGKPLIDAYADTWLWVSDQTPEEGLAPAPDGRSIGLSALAALSMSGNGSGIRAGVQRLQFRVLTRALRSELGNPSSEGEGPAAAGQPEFALDSALAVEALAEALISNPVENLLAEVQFATDGLLALRSPDGLWHQGGDAAQPVDTLVTGLAAYGLYTAMDAGVTVEPVVFEKIAGWSDAAKPAGADDAERAVDIAALLCARTYSYQGLGRSLKEDAVVADLLVAIDAYLPSADSAGQAARNDFAFLATVALYQADNLRWNRLLRWSVAEALSDAGQRKDGNNGFPSGANGRLPSGELATTALRLLQLQSVVREPALSCYAQ